MKVFCVSFALLVLQVVNFVAAFGFLIATGIGLIVPPVGIVLGIVINYVIGEIDVALYEQFPYIKRKNFLLGCFLPICLIYVAGAIAFLIIVFGTDLLKSLLGGESYFIIAICVLYVMNFITFIITALCSIKTCRHCKENGFGLMKVIKTETLDTWYKETGTTDSYTDATFTDSAGNTYSGQVNTGSTTTYDTYEKRKKVAQCKCCKCTYSTVKDYRIGLLRKAIDTLTNKKR